MATELYGLRDQAGETLERASGWLCVSKSFLWNCENGLAHLGPEQEAALRVFYMTRIAERLQRLKDSLTATDNETIPGER